MKTILQTFIILFLMCFNLNLSGQNISIYKKMHTDLLAKQENVQKSILFSEAMKDLNRNSRMKFYQDDLEEKIYRAYWDSEQLSPYLDSEIPMQAHIKLGEYEMPCRYADVITSSYGYRRQFGRMHKGIDLKANVGDTIRSVFDGQVRLSKFERGGFGFYLVVRHYNNTETVYAHLSRFLVRPNQYIKAGDPIALSGNSGRSTGPHLHFEIRYMGCAINPEEIFNFRTKSLVSENYTFIKQKPNSINSRSYTKTHKSKRPKRKRS